MAKRGAAVQLTDRNWDEEEENEVAGHFKVADDDQLSKRVIRKAKRRVTGSDETSGSFKSFQGFGVPQNSSTPMISNAPNTLSLTGFKGFGNGNEKKDNAQVATSDLNSAYMTQLKRLNQEVCEWIKKHINENPYVDLTPVFKDYEKHLGNLEKKFPAACKPVEMSNISPKITTSGGMSSSVVHSFNGGTTTNLSRANDVKPPESCESSDDTPQNIQSQAKSTPEEEAFYSIRCKLFFKRDNDWSELGVGTLSLKKITTEKIRVLVRNDTALSKILLNIFVSNETPTSRSGNNVLLMSVPNPPVFGKEGDNTKPVSYLIRVKTSEKADELRNNLKTSDD
ncbi:nuclear pore complex protein Nup50-like [Dendronephthya gigantea]|uniref:nuclear pore complex protein Nup50-like n=1 Tax=Dendronephthya gigantea TaxID=151771 RepID=UPI001069B006|nr:nuclear pore complex protein Nup50-like [Dendronephthya gigantea]